ncbi:MAG: hypothetical protein FJ313_02785, partial [Gemmatimonadetes bacterium]|nr:hypothetical protein [Gemmatimonadota bacterium]
MGDRRLHGRARLTISRGVRGLSMRPGAALTRAAALAWASARGVAAGGGWRRRAWIGLVGLVGAAFLLTARGHGLRLSPAEMVSARHRHDLIAWEVSNLPAKWLSRLVEFLPWTDSLADRQPVVLDRYRELTVQVREARGNLERAVARGEGTTGEAAALRDALLVLEVEQRSLRDAVEELLERAVSAVVVEEGLNVAGGFIWPPVDVRLGLTPDLLVTSPRDRIERLESVLLKPQAPAAAIEEMESRLLAEENLSAVVVKTGGVATYPAVIPDDADLPLLLETAAHEWLHAYLFFHPLGQRMFRDDDMFTLNETLANVFGREVGRRAYEHLTGERLPAAPAHGTEAEDAEASAFTFDRFMRETRLRTDGLLEKGDIEGAERYMEERRLELNSYGYSIRKINQAWFAFHGTYADSPASVSPIAGELEELRRLVPDIGGMVRL